MVLNDYTNLLCDLMQANYDEAVEIESRFQAAYDIEKIEDCAQFIEDLSKDGEWPLHDDGDPLTPKSLIEKVVADKDCFKNIGLLIILGRIWTRLEKAAHAVPRTEVQ